jgi:hypothetical protein
MMGQLPPSRNTLFYDFYLEEFVSQDHLLLQIDPLLDLSDLRDHLARISHQDHGSRRRIRDRKRRSGAKSVAIATV